MRSICCECNILFDVKEPFDNDQETHGYCDECFKMVMVNIGELKRQRTNKILKEVKSNE